VSEYQYYEFQAIDRPLTDREMQELRSYSTRARITSTSFVNDYSWGNFKGDEDAWMEKYFDAFLHVANWGTHVLKLRLPARLLGVKTARLYCDGEFVSVREKAGKTILTFLSDEEPDDDWVEGNGQLSSLLSIRSDLARGDLRALYLGWLLYAQGGEVDDDEIEPPVPPGLNELSGSLESLVAFLRIDTDLLDAAAAASPALVRMEPTPAEVRRWLSKLPVAEKDDLLTRLVADNDRALADELVQRMQHERESGEGAPKGRSVAELLRAGKEIADERMRVAAEKAAREKEARDRAAARARARHLDELAGREGALWAKVGDLIATKQPKNYDEALALLIDLRDLAARHDDVEFRERVEALRDAHARKPTLIQRLDKAGL
jgi:hypothetical protein